MVSDMELFVIDVMILVLGMLAGMVVVTSIYLLVVCVTAWILGEADGE